MLSRNSELSTVCRLGSLRTRWELTALPRFHGWIGEGRRVRRGQGRRKTGGRGRREVRVEREGRKRKGGEGMGSGRKEKKVHVHSLRLSNVKSWIRPCVPIIFVPGSNNCTKIPSAAGGVGWQQYFTFSSNSTFSGFLSISSEWPKLQASNMVGLQSLTRSVLSTNEKLKFVPERDNQ